MTPQVVQKTNIASTVELVNGMRQIARKSNGDIVALIQQSGGVCRPWISTDEGATWTQGDTDLGYGSTDATSDTVSRAGVSLAVDSSDVFHACGFDAAAGVGQYDQFTISSTGAVTMNVTGETVDSSNDFQWGEIVVDSSDVPWIFGGFANRTMGTAYRHLRIYNRSGGSWSTIARPDVGGELNYRFPSAAFDANGDFHVVYQQPPNGKWRKWDVSAGSLSSDRDVGFSEFNGHFAISDGNIYVVNEEYFSFRSAAGTSAFINDEYFYSHERFFTDNDGSYRSTIGVSNGQIYVFKPFEFPDIYHVHGPDTSQMWTGVQQFEAMTGSSHKMSVAWSQHSHHEAEQGSLDCLAYDITNSQMFYLQFRPTGTQRRTTSTGAVESLSTGVAPTTDFDGTRDRYWMPFGVAGDDTSIRPEAFAWNPVEQAFSKRRGDDNAGSIPSLDRESGAALGYNNELYYAGGIEGSILSELIRYEPYTDTWFLMSSMPQARRYFGFEEVNDFGYAFGGESPSTGSWTAAVDRYDFINDAWDTTPTNLSTARQVVVSEEVDGVIYLIGGYDGSSFYGITESYDPSTDTYTTLTTKPTVAAIGGSAVVDGKIHYFGGVSSGGTHLNTHEVYDISADSWSSAAALPGDARGYMFSFSHDGLVHSIGGLNGGTVTGYARHDVYDPATDTWDTSYPDLPYAMSNSTATKVPVRG